MASTSLRTETKESYHTIPNHVEEKIIKTNGNNDKEDSFEQKSQLIDQSWIVLIVILPLFITT